MSLKRDVLELFKRDELLAAVDRFDLAVEDRRVKEALVEALAGSRRAALAQILGVLSRERMKEICRALGLDDSGREKAVLVARLTGQAPAVLPVAAAAPPAPAAASSRVERAPLRAGRTRALKKSELYSSIWQSCDALRGGMDASQYKDYVLVLLFLKYVSDKYAGKPYAPIEVPAGASFRDLVALNKVNKANVAARLKEIQGDEDAKDEAAVLSAWLTLNGEEADLKKRLKEAEAALDSQAYAKYPKLTEPEVKTLVVDDKWLAALDAAIHGEMDRVSQQLTQRVKELVERYETPLPQMVSRVAELEARVNHHLERMGFAWK